MLNQVFILILLLLFFFNSEAQKKFNVTIEFPNNIDCKKIKFQYDNGKERYGNLKPTFKNNTVVISEIYYSKYATIYVDYMKGTTGFNNAFWVTDKSASIRFSPDKDSTQSPLKNFKLKNAYSLNSIGQEKLNKFYALEEKDFFDFLQKIRGNMNDSLVQIAFEKAKVRNKKIIEFVSTNGDLYYSFWLFRNRIITDMDANPDSLIKTYNTIFSDSLKKSFEGNEIIKYLNGRRLSINNNYIDFIANDITGKIFSLSKCQSKYVLLTFWASWCGPCIKELTYIKELRKLYSNDELEIVSVSWDNQLLDLTKAIKRYQINWIHIFDNNEITNSYGIVAIPEVFLIDILSKKIIYRNHENDYDMVNIHKILTESLKR